MWGNSPAMTREYSPMPRYGHPYNHADEEQSGNDMWGACLGVIICISLVMLLTLTVSYPINSYYYPDDPKDRGYYHNYNNYNDRCPTCWM